MQRYLTQDQSMMYEKNKSAADKCNDIRDLM